MAESSTVIEVKNYVIRDAAPSDLPAIVDIYNEAIAGRVATAQLEPVTVEARQDWLSQHPPDEYPFWVLEAEGRIAGWLTFKSFLPRCAYRGTAELSVYVHSDFRRRGVARALLQKAIDQAPHLGITTVVGLIFAHNEPSNHLFQQLGFSRWGYLPRVARMDDQERDLTIMGRQV